MDFRGLWYGRVGSEVPVGPQDTAMIAEYVQHALIGLALVLGFAVVCYLSIRYEKGRRRIYERMTPEEKREEAVFRRGAFRRR